jgi:hypothetical protein
MTSDIKRTPVFITSFNRPRYLSLLVSWLEENDFENIIILDNASTYPPLLDYLSRSPHQVHSFPSNLGHLALWRSGQLTHIVNKIPFILTDCDIIPDIDCPDDFIELFFHLLLSNPDLTKVGFSLRIDNLPDHYISRGDVIAHESVFWRDQRSDGHFNAPIDTTFALYKPNISPEHPEWFRSIRTAPPYSALHLPWYENSRHLDNEEIFYRTRATSLTHWTSSNFRAEFPDATSPSTFDYWIGSMVDLLQPARVLDIGAGTGKIGQIIRSAQKRTFFETDLSCIEFNPEYISLFSLDQIYDKIDASDATLLLTNFEIKADLAVLSHTIQYMKRSVVLDIIDFLFFRSAYICLVFPDARNTSLNKLNLNSIWDPKEFGKFDVVHHNWSGEHLVLIRGLLPSRMTITA